MDRIGSIESIFQIQEKKPIEVPDDDMTSIPKISTLSSERGSIFG